MYTQETSPKAVRRIFLVVESTVFTIVFLGALALLFLVPMALS